MMHFPHPGLHDYFAFGARGPELLLAACCLSSSVQHTPVSREWFIGLALKFDTYDNILT
jgi:hypothetical protein